TLSRQPPTPMGCPPALYRASPRARWAQGVFSISLRRRKRGYSRPPFHWRVPAVTETQSPQRSLPMKKLVLETTSPFQGVPELVAYSEGLFAKEGLQVEWADRDEAGVKTVDTSLKDVKGADPFGSHGTLLEQGKADMYNACEWGNYCRAGATGVGSRQVGRRAIVTYAAIVVRPDSPVFTPQQLAGRTVGVPFYAGTHYLALHLLEGFLPRDQINVCRAPNGSRNRFNLMMKGELEATTLTEPYLTLAEKKGCRL